MLVDSTDDPIAAKIRYHFKCYRKHMREVYDCDNGEEQLQNVSRTDVQKKFIDEVKLLEDICPENLETFLIKYIYNDTVSKSLPEMRKNIWNRTKIKNRKTLARIGPDKISNDLRIKRVLFQIKVAESFENPTEPGSPLDNGYKPGTFKKLFRRHFQ